MQRARASFARVGAAILVALAVGMAACKAREAPRGPVTQQPSKPEASEPQEPPALAQAKALRAQGKLAEARALLQTSMAAWPPEAQSRARALLARIALAEGDYDAAASGLRQSMNEAFEHGRNGDAVYDGTALAYTLVSRKHAYAEARSVIERLTSSSKNDPASLAILPHYAGLIALRTGDLRSALASFRKAISLTHARGLRDHELLARQNEAQTLSLLGRHAEAIAAQREIVSRLESQDACRNVDAQEQLLWLVIVSEAAPASPERAIGQRAADAAQAALVKCKSPVRLRNHAINLGLFALQNADLARARAALDELDAVQGGRDAMLVTWEHELRGRLLLAQDQARQAEAMFRRALEQSQRAALWDSELLAQQGLGRSLEAQGKLRDAAAAYAHAEDWMDKLLGAVPLGEGQAGFLHERERGTARLIALLLRLRDPKRALLVARNARARVLRANSHPARLSQLDPKARARFEAALARFQSVRSRLEAEQADAWMLSKERLEEARPARDAERRSALAALDEAQALLQGETPSSNATFDEPAPGAALLVFVPLEGSMAVFVSFAGKTSARVVEALDQRATAKVLGERLLAPLRHWLDKAQRIEVLTQGELSALDVHAFVIDGAPAAERWTISYKLDLASGADAPRVDEAAFVVANPKEDLPFAETEGQAVAQALSAANMPVRRLIGANATRAQVFAELQKATLFHYAGHGVFAGHEGIDSGLRLADGELSLGDILVATRVPEVVVLSACEGARERTPGLAAGLSIAQAFIARGARAVVAATRNVSDAQTRLLIDAFYAARAAQPQADIAGALRTAQLQLRERMPDADWSSFRVLTP